MGPEPENDRCLLQYSFSQLSRAISDGSEECLTGLESRQGSGLAQRRRVELGDCVPYWSGVTLKSQVVSEAVPTLITPSANEQKKRTPVWFGV